MCILLLASWLALQAELRYLPEWVWQSNQVRVLHRSLITCHQVIPSKLYHNMMVHCHDGGKATGKRADSACCCAQTEWYWPLYNTGKSERGVRTI